MLQILKLNPEIIGINGMYKECSEEILEGIRKTRYFSVAGVNGDSLEMVNLLPAVNIIVLPNNLGLNIMTDYVNSRCFM